MYNSDLVLVIKAENIVNNGNYQYLNGLSLHYLIPDLISIILSEDSLKYREKSIILDTIQSAIEHRYNKMPFDDFKWEDKNESD